MYVDETADTADPAATPAPTASTLPAPAQPVPTSGGQWAVEPEQVNAFASAIVQVRAHLDKVRDQVDELSGPDYQPRLGTSPTGQQLARKFNDRLTSDAGLAGQLRIALKNLEDFVSSAEKAAATYLESDNASADTLRQQA
jgi:hypothetical protein